MHVGSSCEIRNDSRQWETNKMPGSQCLYPPFRGNQWVESGRSKESLSAEDQYIQTPHRGLLQLLSRSLRKCAFCGCLQASIQFLVLCYCWLQASSSVSMCTSSKSTEVWPVLGSWTLEGRPLSMLLVEVRKAKIASETKLWRVSKSKPSYIFKSNVCWHSVVARDAN